MGIQLVDPSKEYELKHPSGASFTMRHWTVALQEIVDQECISLSGNGEYKYNVSREREIKLDNCVTAWSGIEDEDGGQMPCTSENKRKLPVGIVVWIVKEIDTRAGLRFIPEEKKS